MDAVKYKYPYFWMQKEWTEYNKTLGNPSEEVALYMAIAEYGLNETEPRNLTPRTMDYFNNVIRAELDAQHAEYNANGNDQ